MGDRLGIRDVVDIIFLELSLRKPPIVLVNKFPLTLQLVPRGLTARISGFHPGGPGSTPGVGRYFNNYFLEFIRKPHFNNVSSAKTT